MSDEAVKTVRVVMDSLVVMVTAYIAFRMRQLEKNTNSIKDALVTKTEEEALARGTLEGHAAGVRQEQAKGKATKHRKPQHE